MQCTLGAGPSPSMLEAASTACLVLDRRGGVVSRKTAFEQLVRSLGAAADGRGAPASYAQCLSLDLGLDELRAGELERAVREVSTGESGGFAHEVLARGAQGARYLQVLAAPCRESEQICVVHLDVTDAKVSMRQAQLQLAALAGARDLAAVARRLAHSEPGAIAVQFQLEEGRLRGTRLLDGGQVAAIPAELAVESVAWEGSTRRGGAVHPQLSDVDVAIYHAAGGRHARPGAVAFPVGPPGRTGEAVAVVYYGDGVPPRMERDLDLLAELVDEASRSQVATLEAMRRTAAETDALVSLAADSDAPVLLLGESGVGKTRLARLIHNASRRAAGPFLDLNCAGLSPELVESELFGHERGAFTGAATQKRGLLEVVDGGTVLLDEIGELDLGVQAKLLKVLESCRFRRLGGREELASNVRFIAATHRDLWQSVAEGTFREDLLYRLNVIQIAVPALRERAWQIPTLAHTLLADIARREGKPLELSRGAEEELARQEWPGNIRQLRNALERASLGVTGRIERAHVLAALPRVGAPSRTAVAPVVRLTTREREHILAALEATGYNMRKCAAQLGISRSTLYEKARRHGIDVSERRRTRTA